MSAAATKSLPTRMPPHNLDAEQSVLGALMLDKDAIVRIADLLAAADFYKAAHATIYETAIELYEKHEPIDVLSLANRLEEKKRLSDIGGAAYLASLANMVPSASNIVHYASLIHKKAVLRRLISAATIIGEMGYDESEDVDKVLDEAEQALFGVSQNVRRQEFLVMRDALSSAFDRIDELHKNRGQMRGVPTGFPDIDQILSGLQKSDLIILAARPSVGKTSLALDIARHAATGRISDGAPDQSKAIAVGIFSLEMSDDQLVDRMIAAEGDVDLWRLRTGNLRDSDDDNDFERINAAMGVLSEAPIYIDDTSSANIMRLRTMARRLQAEHNLGLIIVDYLQLMQAAVDREPRAGDLRDLPRSQGARQGARRPGPRALAALACRGEPRRPAPRTLGPARIGSDRAGRGRRDVPLPRGPRQERRRTPIRKASPSSSSPSTATARSARPASSSRRPAHRSAHWKKHTPTVFGNFDLRT